MFHETAPPAVIIDNAVERQKQMLGSYAPKPEPYEFVFPLDQWPSGMLARGTYTARAVFTDDHKTEHLKFEYKFDIKKNWPTDPAVNTVTVPGAEANAASAAANE